MAAYIDLFIQGIMETSWLEWLAVLTGVLYVLLAAYEKRMAWIFAGGSTGMYIYLCLTAQLYIESVLQVFYFVMAIYGWLAWKKQKNHIVKITQWKLKWHFFNLLASGCLAILLGYFVGEYTNQANPYLDAFTTVFSLLATFMVAKKVLENWLYWIVIDAALVILYMERGFVLTGVQYAVFTFLALFAYLRWRKLFQKHA